MNKPIVVLMLWISGCATPQGSGPTTKAPAAAPASTATALPMPVGLDERAMDPSVAPCDDFYRYACGGWLDHAEIRKDFPLADRSFVALTLETSDQVRALLDDAAAGKGAPASPVNQLLGDFYGACMDEQAYVGAVAVLRGELEALGAVRDATTLARQLAVLHRRGGHAFFTFGATVDPDTSTTYVAELDQGGMGLPTRDYYLGSDDKTRAIRDGYRAYITRVSGLLGDPPAAAAKRADAVLAIETALAKAALSPLERRDAQRLKNRFDLAGLRTKAPAFPWAVYFEAAGVPEVGSLNVVNPATLVATDKLVRSTPWPTLRAYLGWRLIVADSNALPAPLRDARFELDRLLSGAEQQPERWRECSAMTEALLKDAVGQAYVARHFLPEAKQRVAEMATAIAGQLRASLGTLAWMDEATRARAVEKLDAFVLRFGYPDTWRSYADLRLERASFLASWRRAVEHGVRYDDGHVGKPVDRREWSWGATMINMGNSLELNALTFPAAVLQPPIFDVRAPLAVIYGTSGVFIGHEFTHGFDDQGRQFDAHGGTNGWWSETSSTSFRERAACLKDQFDKELCLDDVHVNGALTLGENIADLGGAKMAYAAMTAATRGAPPAAPARFTPPQQFFLGYAQVWCSKYRPEFSRLLAGADPHSPPSLRVNMPLRNMPEFQQAFACPAPSKMVRPPAERCDVW